MSRNYLHYFITALESIRQNKLRAFLTSLGIIFGVASVIAMMAIGKGAEEEVLKQLRTLGSSNIIIRANVEEPGQQESAEGQLAKAKKKFSPGLTMKDGESILKIIPGVESVSPEVSKKVIIIAGDKRLDGSVTGVSPKFFLLSGFEMEEGQPFKEWQADSAKDVCVIGQELRIKLFGTQNPIGKQIKCGRNWLTIKGVAKSRVITGKSLEMGIHDFKAEVFVPIKTFLLKIQDRGKVSPQSTEEMMMMFFAEEEGLNQQAPVRNYHQLDKITVAVKNVDDIRAIAGVVEKMLLRRHNKNKDFEVIVPEELLKQEQQTKATFGYVLIFIASISLLVGGIGIMNIMLASVLERIREIGVRQALGATRRDIVFQFLSEAVTISLIGGFIGIFVGIFACYIIKEWAHVLTIVTFESVGLSFLVSITVGIVFGIFPARRAAMHDPVVSLRYE